MESPGPIQFRTRAGRGAPFDIPITLRLEFVTTPAFAVVFIVRIACMYLLNSIGMHRYEQRKAAERAKLSEGKDAATKAAESLELTVAVLAAEADALRGAVMLRGVDNEFHSPRIRSWTRKVCTLRSTSITNAVLCMFYDSVPYGMHVHRIVPEGRPIQ